MTLPVTLPPLNPDVYRAGTDRVFKTGARAQDKGHPEVWGDRRLQLQKQEVTCSKDKPRR